MSLNGETPTKMCRSTLIADQAVLRTASLTTQPLLSQFLASHLNGFYQQHCASDTGHTLGGW
jgi:hypothetical protein